MDRVPTPILKVYQQDFLVVRERHQDIILLGIVVAQHELISADQCAVVLLIALEEHLAVKRIDSFKQGRVRNALIL